MTLKSIITNLIYALIIFGVIVTCNTVSEIKPNAIILIILLTVLWMLMLLWIRPFTLATILFAGIMLIKPMQNTYYLTIFFFLLSFILDRFKTIRDTIKIPFPILLFILLVAGIQALGRSYSISDGLTYFFSTIFIPVVTIIAIANIPYQKSYLDKWTLTIISVGTFVALVGIIMAFRNPMMRIGSIWITAMTINGFYTLAIFFALAWAVRVKNTLFKILFFMATAIIFIGMIDTYTRMALLAVIFGFVILIFSIKNFRYLGIICLLVIPLLIPSAMVTRINAGFEQDVSILIRLVAWYQAIHQISHHLLWGIGFETWKHLYGSWVPIKMLYAQHPHNLYIRVMLEIGLFGFLAYFGIILHILYNHMKYTYRIYRQSYSFVLYVAILALLFACLTDIFIQQYNITFPTWITLALLYQQAIYNKQVLEQSKSICT